MCFNMHSLHCRTRLQPPLLRGIHQILRNPIWRANMSSPVPVLAIVHRACIRHLTENTYYLPWQLIWYLPNKTWGSTIAIGITDHSRCHFLYNPIRWSNFRNLFRQSFAHFSHDTTIAWHHIDPTINPTREPGISHRSSRKANQYKSYSQTCTNNLVNVLGTHCPKVFMVLSGSYHIASWSTPQGALPGAWHRSRVSTWILGVLMVMAL